MKKLFLFIFIFGLTGCLTENDPDFKNLLYEEPDPMFRYIAYKSVTIKD